MAKNEKTPSYSIELELDSNPKDVRLLEDRFLCSTRLQNTMLQYGRESIASMKSEPGWKEARNLSKKEKQKYYSDLRKKYKFSANEWQEIAREHAKKAEFRIGSHEIQIISDKVFESCNDYLLGKKGKPRFKGEFRPVHSIRGKNNKANLQWKPSEGVLQVSKGWKIKAIFPDLKRDEWLWTGLQDRTKYCRVLWRNVRGEKRWFLQLIQEGLSPAKKHAKADKESIGGFDLGPSSFAWVTGTEAGLVNLRRNTSKVDAEIAKLQRGIAHKRQLNNPHKFNTDGSVKKGDKSKWIISETQALLQKELSELQRKQAAILKNSHGQLINVLLSKALNWQHDGVSVKALQKLWGKSVGKCAPGLLVSELKRKAERAGGKSEPINVYELKTSQYDHSVDQFFKKQLKDRKHIFKDGRGWCQRDIYSAFLHCNSTGNTHEPSHLEERWVVRRSGKTL